MTDNFQEKILALNQKLAIIQRPHSTIEKLSQCRAHFFKFKKNAELKLKEFKDILNRFGSQIENKSEKIQKQKKIINNFSDHKHEQLIQIVKQQVRQFDINLQRAKQELKICQIAADQKISEYQRESQVIASTYQSRLNKNIKSVYKQIQNYEKMCDEQSKYIKNEFINLKKIYENSLMKRQKSIMLMQKTINCKLEQANQKLAIISQQLYEKWRVKDLKTKKIFQTLIQMM